jgi:hypothetical protein
MNKLIKVICVLAIGLAPTISISSTANLTGTVSSSLGMAGSVITHLVSSNQSNPESISFSDYIRLDKKNRNALGNKIIILGANKKQYNLYKGEIVIPIPLEIRNILLLLDEALIKKQFSKLDFIGKHAYPNPMPLATIFQLAKPSPYTPSQNLSLVKALNINIDSVTNLTILDIYVALNGTLTHSDYGKQIYVYPHSDLHNKLVFRDDSNGYIIINGSLSGNKIKPFSGITANSLNNFTNLFTKLVVFNSINEYDRYKSTKNLKVIENGNCIILEGECIEIY